MKSCTNWAVLAKSPTKELYRLTIQVNAARCRSELPRNATPCVSIGGRDVKFTGTVSLHGNHTAVITIPNISAVWSAMSTLGINVTAKPLSRTSLSHLRQIANMLSLWILIACFSACAFGAHSSFQIITTASTSSIAATSTVAGNHSGQFNPAVSSVVGITPSNVPQSDPTIKTITVSIPCNSDLHPATVTTTSTKIRTETRTQLVTQSAQGMKTVTRTQVSVVFSTAPATTETQYITTTKTLTNAVAAAISSVLTVTQTVTSIVTTTSVSDSTAQAFITVTQDSAFTTIETISVTESTTTGLQTSVFSPFKTLQTDSYRLTRSPPQPHQPKPPPQLPPPLLQLALAPLALRQ